MNYQTIAQAGLSQDIIKKSRFICQSKRISSEEEGRAFINQIKKEHYKANHSCSAMIIGEHQEIKRSSDDGEPSGTAGIPMLTVLEKQQVTNLVVVVTRYFGGIKLGTGGLIRAYSGSVAQHLKEVGLIRVKKQTGILLELSYPQYQHLPNFLEMQGLSEYNTQFLEIVRTTLYVDKEMITDLKGALTEFYQGKVHFAISGSQVVEIPIS